MVKVKRFATTHLYVANPLCAVTEPADVLKQDKVRIKMAQRVPERLEVDEDWEGFKTSELPTQAQQKLWKEREMERATRRESHRVDGCPWKRFERDKAVIMKQESVTRTKMMKLARNWDPFAAEHVVHKGGAEYRVGTIIGREFDAGQVFASTWYGTIIAFQEPSRTHKILDKAYVLYHIDGEVELESLLMDDEIQWVRQETAIRAPGGIYGYSYLPVVNLWATASYFTGKEPTMSQLEHDFPVNGQWPKDEPEPDDEVDLIDLLDFLEESASPPPVVSDSEDSEEEERRLSHPNRLIGMPGKCPRPLPPLVHPPPPPHLL